MIEKNGAIIQNSDKNSSIILLCDHASNSLPNGIKLGISDAELSRHIGYDIGIKNITQILADKFHCSAIYSKYSRLYIDCNRVYNDETLIPEISDATTIPFNKNITQIEKDFRWNSVHQPYQTEVKNLIEQNINATGKKPLLVSMHSFTEQMQNTTDTRPWEVGILWKRDEKLAKKLIDLLRQDTDFTVGDNQPYDERDKPGYTVEKHAEDFHCESLILELRQDLLVKDNDIEKFVNVLQNSLTKILAK